VGTLQVYVVGGFVDEALKPGVTLQRAKEKQIRTLRLPIPELTVMEKSYAPVLAINQV
jgi:hypothetical protein